MTHPGGRQTGYTEVAWLGQLGRIEKETLNSKIIAYFRGLRVISLDAYFEFSP